jgi:hypothetical protein
MANPVDDIKKYLFEPFAKKRKQEIDRKLLPAIKNAHPKCQETIQSFKYSLQSAQLALAAPYNIMSLMKDQELALHLIVCKLNEKGYKLIQQNGAIDTDAPPEVMREIYDYLDQVGPQFKASKGWQPRKKQNVFTQYQDMCQPSEPDNVRKGLKELLNQGAVQLWGTYEHLANGLCDVLMKHVPNCAPKAKKNKKLDKYIGKNGLSCDMNSPYVIRDMYTAALTHMQALYQIDLVMLFERRCLFTHHRGTVDKEYLKKFIEKHSQSKYYEDLDEILKADYFEGCKASEYQKTGNCRQDQLFLETTDINKHFKSVINASVAMINAVTSALPKSNG